MPEGGTVIVNLPTGAGKTLAFQLPALSSASDAGLTLVLVPTVALARDQEERFRLFLERHPHGRNWTGIPLAYYGGLAEESKIAIRAGIRQGSLPIVFCSPEAALGALRGPLFEAARHGRLRLFAIDEAHIVSQWGQQFRPEFQSVAGLRNALLESCPPDSRFRTLLLTATLTPESYETLRLLFGREQCQMVSDVFLRPEPGFLLRTATTEAERCARVLEAVRNLPRPLILYTTLREHAEDWAKRLFDAGFRRLRLVRGGDLGDVEGDAVLRDWRSGAVDVIVATSAFGLGMDQAEVRSVIHACLPETIDRFYQEVGRAGRDGRAAVSLLVSTPDDVQTASGLAEEKLIGLEKGFERWEEMFRTGHPGGNDTHVVSLDAKPPRIAQVGVRNASWNLRALVLMARAGLLEFAAHPPPRVEQEPDEGDDAFDERRRKIIEPSFREVAVRINDNRHIVRSHWDQAVERTRTDLRKADQEASRLVRELRDLKRPLNDLFRDVYSLSDPFIRPPRFSGSCPVTRKEGTVAFRSIDPETTTLATTASRISQVLERALSPCSDTGGRAWVAYDPPTADAKEIRRWRERLLSLLRYVVSHGVVEVSLPEDALADGDWNQLNTRAALRFLIRTPLAHRPDPLTAEMAVPRLTLIGERDSSDTVTRIMQLHRPAHVVVLPRDVPDPVRPDRRFFDVAKHLFIDDLLARLAS